MRLKKTGLTISREQAPPLLYRAPVILERVCSQNSQGLTRLDSENSTHVHSAYTPIDGTLTCSNGAALLSAISSAFLPRRLAGLLSLRR